VELYLIRHGQSTNNALANQTQRAHDPALTSLGVQQAERLAAYLRETPSRDPLVDTATGYTEALDERGVRFTNLYVSPMQRALLTAAPVAAALNVRPEVWVAIHEHGGIYLEAESGIVGFPGMTRAEIAAAFPTFLLPDALSDAGWWQPERGHEPLSDAYGRAIAVALELRRRARHEPEACIGLITHGTFMDALIKALFNLLPNRSAYFLHYNTALTRIDFRADDRLLLRCMNRVDHLPPELIS
jgi:broad specificity phosphatase PhoE